MIVIMNVYLVRHGAYALDMFSDRGPALSAYGREQARAVGDFFLREGFPVTQVITSTYLRAQETAACIQEQLGCCLEPIELMDFSPSGDETTMRSIIEGFSTEGLLVVGHMCSIGYLARALCVDAPTVFNTCTAVVLEGAPKAWRVKRIFHAL